MLFEMEFVANFVIRYFHIFPSRIQIQRIILFLIVIVGHKSRSVKSYLNRAISQQKTSRINVAAISEGLPTPMTIEIIYNY